MVDKRSDFLKSAISKEFDNQSCEYWFDYKPKKFLHQIDTFYYSVKLVEDLRKESSSIQVDSFRLWFKNHIDDLEKNNAFELCKSVYIDGWESNLNLKPFNFAGYYKYCLSCPDMFDIFIAPVVPPASDGGVSVTCEIIVQIRSYCLWLYGVYMAFEMSYFYIDKLLEYFDLHCDYTMENRVDFCWHSNYIKSPEKFFNPERFYDMRVDRFKGAMFHTEKKGQFSYDMDYIAMGKRSDKIFLRIYLKSKEVVEMGYKPFFFKVWLFNGLINRFDFYVYEECFRRRSWQYVDMARVKWYSEYGSDSFLISECKDLLDGRKKLNADQLQKFADSLTPKIHLIMNVEYQVMRKHSKSYCLVPFKDNSNQGIHKRIYDFFDNRALIIDYLTNDVFRLAKLSDGMTDTNKSRRENCGFWSALRSTKLVDCVLKPDSVHLVRNYNRDLNADIVRMRALKSAVTLGIYYKGNNDDTPIDDLVDALCVLNDNDIKEAERFKNKKLRQFSEKELAKLSLIESPHRHYSVLDTLSGEIR